MARATGSVSLEQAVRISCIGKKRLGQLFRGVDLCLGGQRSTGSPDGFTAPTATSTSSQVVASTFNHRWKTSVRFVCLGMRDDCLLSFCRAVPNRGVRPSVVLVGIARSKQPFSGYAPLSQSPIVTHGPPGSASAKGVFAPTVMLDPRAGVGGISEPGQLTARVWFFQSTNCTGWCPVTINEAIAPWPLYKGDGSE